MTPADHGGDKGEARRRQILEAAIRCFRKNGFHAASMSSLAKEAGMSVGHMNHYFENKEAIIDAFVEEKLESFYDLMNRLREAGPPLADAMVDDAVHGFDDMCDPDNARLFLEITAEAARNPAVGGAVREVDRKIRSAFSDFLAESCGCGEDGDRAALNGRIEMVAAVYEGLTIRAIRHPDLDREATLAALRLVIGRLMSP
jgi:AcrR family transcriptional regulator